MLPVTRKIERGEVFMVKTLKTFYSFLARYKGAFVLHLLVLVIVAILENLNPYIYKLLIDSITGERFQKVFFYLFLFISLKLFVNFGNALSRFLGDRVLIPSSSDARITIFKKVQDLDFAFHSDKYTGSLISIFKRGDNAFENIFDSFNEILRIFISLAVLLFFFGKISSFIVLIMLGIFLINSILSFFLLRINMEKRKLFNDAEDRISGIITDNLINYETVKFFAQEKSEENRLKKEFIDWKAKIWAFANSFRLMDVSIGTVSNIGLFFIFWISLNRLINKQISIGDFVMVASFLTGFYYAFFELLWRVRNIIRHFVDVKNYFALLDEEIKVQDPQNPQRIEEVKGNIEFKNVTFSYKDSEPVLKDISLTIKAGESVAFVGRSGAGKTTLIKLLLRFYDVTNGEILLDKVNIKNLSKNQLRSYIGVVPQEPILFNNTIGYNIAYGHPKATQNEIEEAAKLANLHDFIESLPQKYKTPVGERGVKLSGGQKQRLAIARAILFNPKIIIFDEATSNLDSESEKLIQEALWKVAQGRTVLIIAHRFSTVRRADKIVVLEGGKIVQTGKHEELISNPNGLYYYLWNLQTRDGERQIGEDEDFLSKPGSLKY